MKLSYYRISLDVHDATSQLSFSVKKGDTSRRLLVSLMDNGVPYVIEKDCHAVFYARKPDGTQIANDCTINGNMIIYDVTQQTTLVEGRLDCEITLYGTTGEQITSPRFAIIVYASVFTEDEVESSDEYKSLHTLVNEANSIANEFKSAITAIPTMQAKQKEFDLAKLEAEGWVTEFVISEHDATQFSAYIYLDGEDYNANNEPIIAFKVNNELVEHIKDCYEEEGEYDYLLMMDLPIGTSIKIYHNPNLARKTSLISDAYYTPEEDTNPEKDIVFEIYKCSKSLSYFGTDRPVRCYSLPQTVQDIIFTTCLDITAHVPPNTRYVEICPALIITDESDEDGYTIWKYADLEVHLDGLPEEWYIYGDVEAQPDLSVKGYVPYHLLEEAKAKFPGHAEHIDALLPASKVNEVGGGKLYRHTVDFDFTDTINVNDGFTQEGGEPVNFYASVSFMSTKKYLLEGDYENVDGGYNIDDYVSNVSDVGVFNDNITHHLGNGMSATVWLSSEGDFLSAVIRELGNDYIIFDLSDGRTFQILLSEDYDVPLTCTVIDYVAEL